MRKFTHFPSLFAPTRLNLLPALLLCALSPAYAAEEDTANYKLSVQPSICVSYDSAAPCVMSMLVTWESTRNSDVCLQETRSATGQPVELQCWENMRRGAVEVHYSDTSDVQYWLIDAVSRQMLAQAEVVVINRDLRDSRKRRRHVWSIL